MPTYYDDEEGDSPPDMSPDTIELVPGVDMGTGQMTGSPTPFYSPEQAAARSEVLSQALPPTVGVSPQAGLMGEATKAYRSGVPGLFVQGGPSVPAGMIEVNGQLERSQAAPQPVPWWITSADQFKEQRRQEDFLLNLLAKTQQQGQSRGTQALERAQQLQGRLQLDADLKSGMPFRDALAKNAANLYAGARGPMTSLARLVAPPKPTPTGVTEFTGKSGARYYVNPQTGAIHPLPALKAPSEDASPAQKLAYWSHRLNNIQKQREAAQYSRDPKALEPVNRAEAEALGEVDKILKRSQSQPEKAAPAPDQSNSLEQRQLDYAKQLRKQHPEWSTDKVKSEARKLK